MSAALTDPDDPALCVPQPCLSYETVAGSCRWCRHRWHGLRCSTDPCTCDSSFTSRDDSWRPPHLTGLNARIAVVMHDTGCDGWIGLLACIQRTKHRIRPYLYGEPA